MHFHPLHGTVALNAPGMGSGFNSSLTVTICQLRPLQLPKGRYRAAYPETETNRWVLGIFII